MSTSNLRICKKGHKYYKSSDCPVCPVCEKEKSSGEGFLFGIAAPARRALERQGINSLQKLSKYSEKDLLKLHGIGPSSLPVLRRALKEKDLGFKRS